ncbi:MAG: hypothetical protein MUC36_05610 [Planctomycetes bacterium]|jgi:hypothetical protein|nr:hypothetical protein [Planctomycetota bacterium]
MLDAPDLRRGLGLVFWCCSLLAAAVGAQQAPAHLPRALARACCVQPLDGELWAAGPDFKARFDAQGIEFTPALGRQAPHNLPLALQFTAVGRDRELRDSGMRDGGMRDLGTVAGEPAAPHADGLQVRYHRAACTERYDTSPQGVALSFVFDRLPAGAGDLVVRMRLRTELPLVAANDAGLRFELAGVGGVAIGGVTGIDAAQQRCAGSITLHGDRLELRLPQHFVERASLPLVLDPQIGTVFAVTNSSADYADPAVCGRGLMGASYCCAFVREFSATDHDIRALVLTSTGSVFGSLLLLTSSAGTDDVDPAIGAIVGTATVGRRYVVVYRRGGNLHARSVAEDGTIGAEVVVDASADTMLEPSIGGELTDADNDVLCVYDNVTQDRIEATQIQVSAAGSLNVFTPITVATGSQFSTVGSPRISHHGGRSGRYLIAYTSTNNGSTSSPRGVVVDRNLTVLDSATLDSSSRDDDVRDVDGDGTNWVVAYESRADNTSSDRDIHAVPAFFDVATSTLVPGTSTVVSAIANTDELAPAIGFLGGSYLIAWLRRAAPGSSNTEIFAKSIDAFTCAQCEPTILLANSADIETSVAIATEPYRAFGVLEGEGLVLWEREEVSTGNGDLEGILYGSGDGSLSLSQNGCGSGGDIAASCAVRGNVAFRIRLRGARPASSAWLVLAPRYGSIGCGPCTLRADPFAGLIAPMQTGDAYGNAEASLPIPNSPAVVGIEFYSQWIVAVPAGSCSYLASDFSSWMSVRVE